jgi:tetratricopeptide (TPR) repeat protein
VAKQLKQKHPAPLSAATLRGRISRAESEGRFQQALELAKSLYKQEPSAPHKELVQRMTLGRARQLLREGKDRDAVTILENAVGIDPSQAWHEQLAQELAAAGRVSRALDLLRPYPDSPVLPRVLTLAVDAALGQGKAGRDLLPASLQPSFDLVVHAFAQAETGQDEAARATLQPIGLRSPFLEWKLLLRGLIAYCQRDDPRAMENWQRLNQERLPARLAAPLRFTIDPVYRLAQSPATQASLQHMADRLQNSGLVHPLRTIQSALANEHKLPQAFRMAEEVLPTLRQQAPHLVPRLASCFFWTVIHAGMPEDITRFRRVFGSPVDDPHCQHLEALAHEQHHNLAQAHKAWQEFEKDVAAAPGVWPGDQAERVRALIWHHMGTNAAGIPDKEELAEIPRFLRNHPDRPRPLNPGPEKCFERSLELAADRLETHEALFKYWQRKHKVKEALKAGRRLLERFPDHVPTLESLGDLHLEQKHFREGLELLQQALRHNPLERRLRSKVSHAHLLTARDHAEAGGFDEARREYQAALPLEEGTKDATVLCKWAACEFKAGAAERAEALLQQALGEGENRLAVAYNMLIEVIRLKLPRPLKTRFDREFKAGLAEEPTAAAAAMIASTAASHRAAGFKYTGQKTHEKQVTAYLEKALKAEFTEAQLLSICSSLAELDSRKLALKYIKKGQKRFPNHPSFYIYEVEHNINLGPHRCPIWPTQELLKKAQDLVSAQPPDAQRAGLLETIQRAQEMVNMLNPFSDLPFTGGPLGDLFDADEEDDDWDDSGFGW